MQHAPVNDQHISRARRAKAEAAEWATLGHSEKVACIAKATSNKATGA